MIKNLHIFPSTQKDHLLSQKMNDKINMDNEYKTVFVKSLFTKHYINFSFTLHFKILSRKQLENTF